MDRVQDGALATDVFEARECATLGTHFRDIYRGDSLFAEQVPAEIADRFVADPYRFPSAHATVPKMRTWLIERDFVRFHGV